MIATEPTGPPNVNGQETRAPMVSYAFTVLTTLTNTAYFSMWPRAPWISNATNTTAGAMHTPKMPRARARTSIKMEDYKHIAASAKTKY